MMTASVSGGIGAISYEWQLQDTSGWTTVGTSSTYNTPVHPAGTYEYRVVVTRSAGCSATSANVTITVLEDPTVDVSALSAQICTGGPGQVIANVSGGTGTVE